MILTTAEQYTTRCGAFLTALFLLGPMCTPGFAQGVVLRRDPIASSGNQSFKNVVRDANGVLYCVSIVGTEDDERQLAVLVSDDDGASWNERSFLFNDETSGLIAPDPKTTGCAVAIDDRGTLHVTWARYSYPSSYRQYYRNWNPASGASSEIFNVSEWTGAALTARTAAMDIAVDQDGRIWLVTHGTGSWAEQLAYSTRPYAEDLAFVDVGRISPSASAQTARIAIDPAGRVHCAFYRNVGAGQFEHRIYDPETGWGDSTNLGNTTPANDAWGVLATDALGHAHVLFAEDGTSDSPLWRFRYRRWDAEGGWGDAVPLCDVEAAQHTDIANNHIFTIACDETTGEVTVLYRDLSRGGAFGVVQKQLDDAEFGEFVELGPPTPTPHAYYAPAIRGRLYPASDQTRHGLHLTWQQRSAENDPPKSLNFMTLDDDAESPRFRRGEIDDTGVLNLTDAIFGLSALFIENSPQPGCLDAADSNDDGGFNLSDCIFTLNALFLGGDMPPAPGADSCGPDPTTGDGLDCERYDSC